MSRHPLAAPLGALGLVLVLAAAWTALLGGLRPPDPAPEAASAAPISQADPTPRVEPTRAAVAPVRPAGRTVHLAPLGDFPRETADELAAFYAAKYELGVSILDPLPLEPWMGDAARDQLIADELIEAVRLGHSDLAADPNAVVIGLVAEDLYIRDRTDWAWAFGLRAEGRFAVVSAARMTLGIEQEDRELVMSRLRKMVTRNIGVLYYGFSLRDDPASVLYRDVLGTDDLDRMGEEF